MLWITGEGDRFFTPRKQMQTQTVVMNAVMTNFEMKIKSRYLKFMFHASKGVVKHSSRLQVLFYQWNQVIINIRVRV
jgi:hypothetical protein